MTAPTRRTKEAISVTIPMSLAPMSLSKNGRVHWRARHRAFQDQKTYTLWSLPFTGAAPMIGMPWTAAILDIEWRYARGRAPDDDNAISRVAAARDAFEDAGAVADDAHIRTGMVTFTKVKTGDECVVVSLRREDAL
jgi:hypothetical protein